MATMHRNFYQAAILSTILTIVTGILQSILSLTMGNDVISLPSLPYWILLAIVINGVGSVLMVTYLYLRHYMIAFAAGTIATVGVLVYLFASYQFLAAREMMAFLIPGQVIIVVTGIVFSLTLLLSRAAERSWLKAAGIVGLVTGSLYGSLLLWGIFTPDIATRMSLQKAMLWISLFGNVVPLFYILNFRSEVKVLEAGSPSSRLEKLADAVFMAGVICAFATVAVGVMVGQNAASKMLWERQLAVRAKEWRTLFESGTYTNARGEILDYQLLKPLNYDSTQKYPLVVCLPYNRGVEGSPPAQLLLSDVNRKHYPSFIYVPYCPENAGWGGVPNYPTIDALVFESIEKLQAELSGIDADRIYVTGVSRGGYGSWHFITTRPEMFAAAVPVCGKGDPRLAHRVTDVPVWAFHGKRDLNVPVSGSRDMIDAIKKAGGDPQYTEFEDRAHDIWNEVTATPGVLDWLFAQRRD